MEESALNLLRPIGALLILNAVMAWGYYGYLRNPEDERLFVSSTIIPIVGLIFLFYLFGSLFGKAVLPLIPTQIELFAIFLFFAYMFTLVVIERYLPYRGRKQPLEMCGKKVTLIKNAKKANAFTDLMGRESKITITEPLLKVLNDDEICAVLEHESGHLKNKALTICIAILMYLFFASLFTFFIIMLYLLYSNIEKNFWYTLANYFMLALMIGTFTVAMQLIIWFGEHKADRNSSKKGLLISSLAKISLYNNLQEIYKLKASEFNRIFNSSQFVDVIYQRDVRYFDVLRELLIEVLRKIYYAFFFLKNVFEISTHPPIHFRIFLLKRELQQQKCGREKKNGTDIRFSQ